MAKEHLVRDVKVERSLGCRAHGTVNLREVTNTKSRIKSLNLGEQILGCSGICLAKSHVRLPWMPRRPRTSGLLLCETFTELPASTPKTIWMQTGQINDQTSLKTEENLTANQPLCAVNT